MEGSYAAQLWIETRNRGVRRKFVIRLQSPLTEEQLAILNVEFASLLLSGTITQGGALPGEDEFLELPRLQFSFIRRNFGRLRLLINRINTF